MGEHRKIAATYGGQTQNFHRWKIYNPGINGRLYIKKGSELASVTIELKKSKKKPQENSEIEDFEGEDEDDKFV